MSPQRAEIIARCLRRRNPVNTPRIADGSGWARDLVRRLATSTGKAPDGRAATVHRQCARDADNEDKAQAAPL